MLIVTLLLLASHLLCLDVSFILTSVNCQSCIHCIQYTVHTLTLANSPKLNWQQFTKRVTKCLWKLAVWKIW